MIPIALSILYTRTQFNCSFFGAWFQRRPFVGAGPCACPNRVNHRVIAPAKEGRYYDQSRFFPRYVLFLGEIRGPMAVKKNIPVPLKRNFLGAPGCQKEEFSEERVGN
jgi:hypothetical protein